MNYIIEVKVMKESGFDLKETYNSIVSAQNELRPAAALLIASRRKGAHFQAQKYPSAPENERLCPLTVL